ncbi:hypothetical protein J6590_033791 [Homalodisca vitripennis]|nr:hypothetical protein J6590_033791 [Homalodisca vitripennis]
MAIVCKLLIPVDRESCLKGPFGVNKSTNQSVAWFALIPPVPLSRRRKFLPTPLHCLLMSKDLGSNKLVSSKTILSPGVHFQAFSNCRNVLTLFPKDARTCERILLPASEWRLQSFQPPPVAAVSIPGQSASARHFLAGHTDKTPTLYRELAVRCRIVLPCVRGRQQPNCPRFFFSSQKPSRRVSRCL